MTSRSFEQHLQVAHYSRNHLILFVGEGNFAFSSMLATSFGSACNIYATTVDTYEVFRAKYGVQGIDRVNNLRSRGSKVLFDINITAAASDPYNPGLLVLLSMKFDTVIFNYPHAGYIRETHSFPAGFYYTLHHEDLIRIFFQFVSQMLLKSSGEIHITHKTTVYKRWKFNHSARLCGLSLKRSLLFVPDSFPGYKPCRGAGKNWVTTFPLGKGSRTYIYGIDWSNQLTNIYSY
ncbi:unnamed protein product [Calypogeia fissa]